MYATFGQELYVRETALAAELIADNDEVGERAACIAAGLPYPSARTRARVAAKLVQRLTAGYEDCDCPAAFARLIAGVSDSEARRELIYYAATRADRIVGGIAREVAYPYFVDGRLPREVSESDFTRHNTGRLLTLEPVLTLPFVVWYAATRWEFHSARTVALALRILRQAGLLLSERLAGPSGWLLAYTLAPHGLTLPTFVWGLYDEFACASSPPTVDRVERAAFARTFIIPPSVISARLRDAERAGFLRLADSSGCRRVLLPLKREELVAGLLSDC